MSPAARRALRHTPDTTPSSGRSCRQTTRTHSRGRPLLAALIASLLFHALLFTFMRPDSPRTPVYAGSSLTLMLKTRQAPHQHSPDDPAAGGTPLPSAATSAARKIVHGTTPASAPVNHITVTEERRLPSEKAAPVATATSATKDIVTSASHTTPETGPAPQAAAKTVSTAQPHPTRAPIPAAAREIQASLGERFARSFHYPRLAQRKGWQGRVTLGLRVEADGQFSHIHLLQTSGHALLDSDALSTLRRIARLPEARAWLQGNHHDMVLPVEYRLLGS